MEQKHIQEAARLFVEARRTGKPFKELPPDSKPVNAEESNAIVNEVTRQLNEPIGGWKISFVYRPRERPVIAPLFKKNIFASPATIPPSVCHSLLAEPEVAFHVTQDLPPRQKLYRAEEVAAAVMACPALELNDTRFDTNHRTIRQMMDDRKIVFEAHADHQTCGAYVVGKGRPDWQDFDYPRVPVKMTCNGKTLVERTGGHAFSDPFLPTVVLANELRLRDGIKAGQILVTGSWAGFFPVEADHPVTVDFTGFGSASATFRSK